MVESARLKIWSTNVDMGSNPIPDIFKVGSCPTVVPMLALVVAPAVSGWRGTGRPLPNNK